MLLYRDADRRRIREGAQRSAAVVVPLLIGLVRPASVLDVGCGSGAWLARFLDHGVEDVTGVDGHWIAEADLEIDSTRILRANLEEPLELDRAHDLVLSLEVAHYLPERSAATFVRSLVGLGRVVAFSAAIPFQGGLLHQNEQWPDYWAALFRTHGYRPIDCLRSALWRRAEVDWWYAQNLLLYARPDALASLEGLRRALESTDVERLAVVHPRQHLQAQWLHRAALALRDLRSVTPAGATVVLADEDALGVDWQVAGLLPFLERNGTYAGPPSDDATALQELERLRRNGATHIAFAWPAFWWLQHFRSLANELRERSTRVMESADLIVFELSPAGDGQRLRPAGRS